MTEPKPPPDSPFVGSRAEFNKRYPEWAGAPWMSQTEEAQKIEEKKSVKQYYVLWTYIGNFSKLHEVQAKDAVEAAEKITGFFSADFHARATVYVFDKPPVMTVLPSKE